MPIAVDHWRVKATQRQKREEQADFHGEWLILPSMLERIDRINDSSILPREFSHAS